jgi:SAM-dependent methyltransferase
MFFADRIKGILPGDRVLEIGPGASPHERSDVLLEKKFGTEQEYAAQFGHGEKLVTSKQVVFYEGDTFPFRDHEFDYVICSHVLEHVEDVPVFLNEVFRVAKKGYFEYPLMYYEYLYNFDVHLNLLKYKNGCMNYLVKSKSHLEEFRPIQDFFYESLQKGHVQIINDLLAQMMEGFEWEKPFPCKEVFDTRDVAHEKIEVPLNAIMQAPAPDTNPMVVRLLKRIINKLK